MLAFISCRRIISAPKLLRALHSLRPVRPDLQLPTYGLRPDLQLPTYGLRPVLQFPTMTLNASDEKMRNCEPLIENLRTKRFNNKKDLDKPKQNTIEQTNEHGGRQTKLKQQNNKTKHTKTTKKVAEDWKSH